MTTDPESEESRERLKYLAEKWFPVLCSDEEYEARYGHKRGTTSIIIESQEKWYKPEDFKMPQ